MNITLLAILFVAGFFAAILTCLEVGRALGRRAMTGSRKRLPGLGTVESMVFGLLGLLLALSFTSAATRFEARRGLVVDEANAIGTAWLRIDTLPEAARPQLRDAFRRYTDARLAAHRALPSLAAAQAAADRASALQRPIWDDAVVACRASDPGTKLLVLSAFNTMFDVAATRRAALRAHVPLMIYGFLCAISLVTGLFAGYEMGRSTAKSRLHTIGFALILASTVYVILDFEYPRLGLIRVDDADRELIEVRDAMR